MFFVVYTYIINLFLLYQIRYLIQLISVTTGDCCPLCHVYLQFIRCSPWNNKQISRSSPTFSFAGISVLRNNDSGCRVPQVRYFPTTFKAARNHPLYPSRKRRISVYCTFSCLETILLPTEWDLFWHLAADKRFGFVRAHSIF